MSGPIRLHPRLRHVAPLLSRRQWTARVITWGGAFMMLKERQGVEFVAAMRVFQRIHERLSRR